MNKTTERLIKFLFIIWYLFTYPFDKLARILGLVDKPKFLLNCFIIATVSLLFRKNIYDLLIGLKFTVDTLFYIFLAFTVYFYIWKKTDKSLGEPWKEEYNKWRGNKE